MVSAVSGSSALVPTSSAANPTAAADKILISLLQSSEMLQALASRTSSYLPPGPKLILSLLWGGINVNRSRTISESDVYKFVVSEGGKFSDAHALWVELAPPDATGKSASTIDAADFAFNTYLTHVISTNLASLQTAVTKLRQQQGPASSNGVLGTFNALGGGRRFIGSGFFINVFV